MMMNVRNAIGLMLLVAAIGCSDKEQPEAAAPSSAPAVATNAPAENIAPVEPELGPVVARRIVTVTNLVTVTKTVLVTNVINVAESSLPAGSPAALSSRKTAPYFVSCDVLTDDKFRRELSDSGLRVISVTPCTRALVEASEKSVEKLRAKGTYAVRAMDALDKLGTGAEGDVLIYPLSVIDEKPIAEAVRALGGNPASDRVEGRCVIRAELSGADVMKLAARGDVRRIERNCR